MKKRLSLLMALMMVLSLVPMSVFAAGIVVTTDDDAVSTNVTYTLGSTDIASGKTIAFELTNGAELTTKPVVTVLNASGGTVNLSSISFDADNAGFFTVNTTNTPISAAVGESLKVKVDIVVDFSDSSVGDVKLDADFSDIKYASQTALVATVQEAASTDRTITVTDSEKKISEDGGTLSRFEIKNVGSKTSTVSLTLPSGMIFDAGTSVVGYGATVSLGTTGSRTMDLEIPAGTTRIAVTPKVLVTGNSVSNGPVDLTVKFYETGSTKVAEEIVTTIGQLVDYEVTMKIVEKGEKTIPSIYGGDTTTVKVTIEGVKGSLDTSRVIDFTVDGANVVMVGTGTSTSSVDLTGGTYSGIVEVTATNTADGVAKDGEFSAKINSDSKVEFYLKVKADYDAVGTATIEASQRSWEQTADLAEVSPLFTVETKVTEAKKGESKATANIVIKEAKAGLLNSGDKISLVLDSRRGVEFYDKNVTLEGTNKMTLKSKALSTDGKTLSFVVDKESYKEASVITVSDVVVAIDGNTIDGMFELETQYNANEVATNDYVKVVKEYSATDVTTVFTIGSKNYTVNGEAMTSVEAPYIEAGRTMLPIRAVAEALGLKVDYNTVTKQITFTNDNKVATLVVGADTMYVNGSPFKLSVPSTLKSGTTFVELKSLASAFSVDIAWDAATKSVTING